MRKFIKRTFLANLGIERWIDPIMDSIPEERRKKLIGFNRDEILQRHLFFTDIIGVIAKNWKYFQHLSAGSTDATVGKLEFEILLNYVNKNRADAHAKNIGSPEVVAVDIAVKAIEKALDRYLID